MAGFLGIRREVTDPARTTLVCSADPAGEEAESCVDEGTFASRVTAASSARAVFFTRAVVPMALLGVAGIAVAGTVASGHGGKDTLCGVLGLCSKARIDSDDNNFANDYTILPDTIDNPNERPYHIRTNFHDARHCVESDALGRDVAVHPCDRVNPNQQWILEHETGRIKSRYHPKCLKHHGKGVSLAACTLDDGDLKWVRHTDSQHLSNGKGECLDSWQGLHMQDCNHARLEHMILYRVDESVMRWERKQWPSGPVHIKHAQHGYCLNYPAGGMTVHSEPCDHGKPSQQWVWFRETRQIMTYWHHRCLMAGQADGPYAGMTIVGDCDYKNERQLWYVSGQKRHLSVLGMCIHTEPGKMLRPCNKGTPEVWHIKPLEHWQHHHGGVVPDRDVHPFIEPSKINVPPRIAACKKAGTCGAEHLHHPDAPPSKLWEKLRYEIWKITRQYQAVVHVGDHRGLLFRYGEKWDNKPISIASELKPITGVLAMRLVETGVIGLDDKVNRWLSWWPTSTADSRSYVTLRHCLSFTSGFYGFEDVPPDTFGHEYSIPQDKVDWWEFFCKSTDAIECAKRVLKHTKHAAPPGTIWTYTADHFRIAAAVMVAATHKPFGVLMHEHIFRRTAPEMLHTHKYKRYQYWNPSSHAISTARDYQRFMDAYFNGRLVSNRSLHEIESDQQKTT